MARALAFRAIGTPSARSAAIFLVGLLLLSNVLEASGSAAPREATQEGTVNYNDTWWGYTIYGVLAAISLGIICVSLAPIGLPLTVFVLAIGLFVHILPLSVVFAAFAFCLLCCCCLCNFLCCQRTMHNRLRNRKKRKAASKFYLGDVPVLVTTGAVGTREMSAQSAAASLSGVPVASVLSDEQQGWVPKDPAVSTGPAEPQAFTSPVPVYGVGEMDPSQVVIAYVDAAGMPLAAPQNAGGVLYTQVFATQGPTQPPGG